MDVKSELLQGDYPDGRRMACFKDMVDVREQRAELERVIRELANMIDEQ